MPLLSDEMNAEMLAQAKRFTQGCHGCGAWIVKDYCRSCDEFYWIHGTGCSERRYCKTHYGHRTVLTPFVEAR